jgi:hypothetical protein
MPELTKKQIKLIDSVVDHNIKIIADLMPFDPENSSEDSTDHMEEHWDRADKLISSTTGATARDQLDQGLVVYWRDDQLVAFYNLLLFVGHIF